MTGINAKYHATHLPPCIRGYRVMLHCLDKRFLLLTFYPRIRVSTPWNILIGLTKILSPTPSTLHCRMGQGRLRIPSIHVSTPQDLCWTKKNSSTCPIHFTLQDGTRLTLYPNVHFSAGTYVRLIKILRPTPFSLHCMA